MIEDNKSTYDEDISQQRLPYDEDNNSVMPLTEHLGELRSRLIIIFLFLAVGFTLSFTVSEKLFDLITLPLHKKLSFSFNFPFFSLHASQNSELSLVFLTPAEAFWMHLKISFICGIILTLPVFFYEIWRFISPGLLSHEKKYALPFIFISTLLFLIGTFFCFIIILPFAINFLLTYKTQNLTPMLSVGHYVDFCLKFILAFGAIFELPIVIIFLTKLGLVTPHFLARHRKYAILIAFIIAALLTPTPDAFNQLLMAVPIIVLYEVGIITSKLLYPKDED
jgi:sec-independent protein translocase protein TatC